MSNKPKTVPTKVKNTIQSTTAATKSVSEKKTPDKNLLMLLSIVGIGMICSLLFHRSFTTNEATNMYPYNTFLYNPSERFEDFYNIYKASVNMDPYSYEFPYFPFAFLLMRLFCFMNMDMALMIFQLSFNAFWIIYIYNNFPNKGINKALATAVLGLFSYPFWFVVDRANLEVWIFMSIAMFIYFYKLGKHIPAIIFLSIGIGLKLYPIIFLLLYITDKKYLHALYTLVASTIIAVGSMLCFNGTLAENYHKLSVVLTKFNDIYILGSYSHNLQHNTSIWVPLKLLYYAYQTSTGSFPPHYEQVFNSMYIPFVFTATLIVILMMLLFKMEFWQKVALLVLTSIVMQQSSYDYKLINIYIPLLLLLNTKQSPKFYTVYIVLYALLLIPKDYVIITQDLTIATIINPLLIISIMVMILIECIKRANLVPIKYYFTKNATHNE